MVSVKGSPWKPSRERSYPLPTSPTLEGVASSYPEEERPPSTPPAVYDAPAPTTSSATRRRSTLNGDSSGEVNLNDGATEGGENLDVSLEERLLKTYPVWFLPELHRLGAAHLLHGKEQGAFIVRESSQPNTLAISVRLPPGRGPHVQHYLVEVKPYGGHYSLEASDNSFSSLPALINHYTQCCDELPVRLKLPKCIEEAKTRHELASIALLGQEFWGTPLASPISGEGKTIESPTSGGVVGLRPPHDLSFSSFGKGGITKGVTSALSPLTPTRPAPALPTSFPHDRRTSLYLNLTSPSSNSPLGAEIASLPPPPIRRKQPPTPPVRSPPNSASSITVTTTLTFNVGVGSAHNHAPTSPQIHVSNLQISPLPKTYSPASEEGVGLEGSSGSCHRSSLADKISDYEDLWTVSPPPMMESDLPPTPPKTGGELSPLSKSLRDIRVMGNNIPPFYVEPLDSLRKGRGRLPIRDVISSGKTNCNRHSDSNIDWRTTTTLTKITKRDEGMLSKIEDDDDDDEVVTHSSSSSSQDDITNRNKKKNRLPMMNWDDDVTDDEDEFTVTSLIKEHLPDVPLTMTPSSSRLSAYDNVIRAMTSSTASSSSAGSDSGTEFSEPWDSRKWDSLLDDDVDVAMTSATSDDDIRGLSSSTESLSRIHSNLRSKILSPQRLALRHRRDAESGGAPAVRRYVLALGSDATTTFSQAVRHFLTCTMEGSSKKDVGDVIRNVRQFMSGIKNYLVTSGEGDFDAVVTRERSNLKSTEFVNLDAILEDVLVRLVVRPLRRHINGLYVTALQEGITQLSHSIQYAKTLPHTAFGIRPGLKPPKGATLDSIRILLRNMQRAYAPREKLAHLLGVISHIYQCMYESGVGVGVGVGDADDLVPMLMWVLAHCDFIGAEVEADYLQGLLLPSSASGEAAYYLNALHSAIHALKGLNSQKDDDVRGGVGVMRVVVPDEQNGSLVTRTLPARPHSTARDFCRMMAHTLRLSNPQDYALYALIDGHERVLSETERPEIVRRKASERGSHCLIAFKRIDAKIAWPLNRD